jgi:hypothetical protein
MIGIVPLGTDFLLYVAVVATTALIAVIRFMPIRTGVLGAGVMLLWLGYAATLAELRGFAVLAQVKWLIFHGAPRLGLHYRA